MHIRDAEARDLPAITELFRGVQDTTWEYTETLHSLEERLAWFAERTRDGWPVLVAEDNGEVLGVATYGEFRDSTGWPGYRLTVAHTILVEPSHHRQRVGLGLLSALMRRASEAGVRVIVAGIDSSNVGSISFHQSLGFRETAWMPGVGEKWGHRLDLVLMQRELDASIT